MSTGFKLDILKETLLISSKAKDKTGNNLYLLLLWRFLNVYLLRISLFMDMSLLIVFLAVGL